MNKTYFISYTTRSKNDVDWACWIEYVLRVVVGGKTIMQEYDFRPGDNFKACMDDALKKADIVICVLTRAYMESSNCWEEWSNAERIIPVKCDDFEIKGLLKSRVYINLYGLDKNAARETLVEGLSEKTRPYEEPEIPSAPRKDMTDEPVFSGFVKNNQPDRSQCNEHKVIKAGEKMNGIRTGSFHYLHFSDLHLSTEVDFDTYNARERLLDFLKKETDAGNLPVDYIFITGDIAYKNDFSDAKNYIKRLFESLSWSTDKYSQVFWTVGNHDISRKSELRKLIINDIRNAKSSLNQFQNRIKDPEIRDVLIKKGMDEYDCWHKESGLYSYPHKTDITYHAFHKLPHLNLISINTCLTSCDKNDKNNLFIIDNGLAEKLKNLDTNNPTFVIGHHGKEYFTDETQTRLEHLFGDNMVDLYLCGHSHKPGYQVFATEVQNQVQHQVHEITCGGGFIDNSSVFSFMHGYYDRKETTVTIKTYSYADRGNHNWNLDVTLHSMLNGKTPIQLRKIEQNLQPTIKAKVSHVIDSGALLFGKNEWINNLPVAVEPILKKERTDNE